MLVESLKNKYHSDISFENLSSGGKDSYWGAENINRLIADKNPNLVIIAFGMNDGTKGMSGAVFKRNIKKIINIISQKNSICEYILIAPMLPNEDWSSTTKQAEYRVALNELEREGCAIADVTSIHEYLLTRKRYIDMTGNHVNHPNDFMVRLYAQVIYELFQ